jgi:uncharacterized protein (DUF1810 family)
MWYIFPQIFGLGISQRAVDFALNSLQEARAFLAHDMLGNHLREICEALLKLQGADAVQVFGRTDAMKLRSSMTLFDAVQPHDIFAEVLDKYYDGERDELTLCRLGLNDRMQKALDFIGVEAEDFRINPCMYSFQRKAPTHRFSHIYRVMIGAALIAHEINKPRLGLLAFIVATCSGVLIAKLMNVFSKKKINPLIGSAGVSAVPMAARVSQDVGAKEDPTNFLLMHAMGPNVSGVIGSAVAAGVLLQALS